MLLSPLARQLLRSIKSEPQRWQLSNRSVVRDDAVEIQFIHPYEAGAVRPRLVSPREVSFRGFEAFLIYRAIRRWLHRPI